MQEFCSTSGEMAAWKVELVEFNWGGIKFPKATVTNLGYAS